MLLTRTYRPLLFLVLLVVFTPIASGQTAKYSAKNYTVDDGFSGGWVQTIHEDAFGFLWFGTDIGLVRYDGISFETYSSIEGDSTSLGGMKVLSIHEDPKGNFWLGTDKGISYFNRRKEFFENLSHNDILKVIPSTYNPAYLWVVTAHGLSRFHISTRSFEEIVTKQDNSVEGDNPLFFSTINGRQGIVEDSEGKVWIGYGWGLTVFDAPAYFESEGVSQRPTFTKFFPDPQYPVVNNDDWPANRKNSIGSVFRSPDNDSILWVGSRAGLYKFNIHSHMFERIVIDPKNLHPVDGQAVGEHFSALHFGASGTFWTSTREGIQLFDQATQNFSSIFEQNWRPRDILEDRNGTIWLGGSYGLWQFRPAPYPFTVYGKNDDNPESPLYASWNGITEDQEGTIYLGGVNGIVELSPNQRDAPVLSKINELVTTEGGFMTLLADSKGIFWIGRGGTNELEKYDPVTKSLREFKQDPRNPDPNGIGKGIPLNYIHEDDDGHIWIALYEGGADRLNPETEIFTHFRHDPEDAYSLGSEQLIRLYTPPSSPREVWAVSMDGFSVYHLDRPGFMNYFDPAFMRVRTVIEDSKQRIWVGADSGLHLFDKTDGVVTTWTTSDGLPHDAVTSVLEDDQGNLWIGTNNGLSRFNPDTENFKSFTTKDGIPGNVFPESGFFKSSTGELFFRTYTTSDRDAWFSFYPDQIVNENPKPVLAITQLDIKGLKTTAGDSAPLNQSILFTEDLSLPYNQNELTFHFAGLGVPQPDRNRYQYRLTNFDDTWVEGGNQTSARYNRLPPGNYAFEVRGSYTNDQWGEPRVLNVTISPPWWRTSIAFVVYGLSFIAGFISVDRIRRRRLISKERQQAQIREAELKAEAAQALSREATALARESEARSKEAEAQARVLQEENKRKELEIEKGKELEKSYRELQQALSHLRDTQDQLIHAEKLASLGQLTAGIAHEIKNPLNFVNNFSRLSKELMEELEEWIQERNIQSDEDLEDIIDTLKMNVAKIHHHGNRADGIVKSMLEHSRTEPGQQRATDINKLLDEYVNLAFHSWKAGNEQEENTPAMTKNYDKSAGELSLIPQNIGRVFINLLDNAFYAVGEKAKARSQESGSLVSDYTPLVTLTTQRLADTVKIIISDNGIGIPADIKDKVFEPFFTTKPTGSGTGLGLSLSYDIIVQGHSGDLKVESEEGEGASFIITLPL